MQYLKNTTRLHDRKFVMIEQQISPPYVKPLGDSYGPSSREDYDYYPRRVENKCTCIDIYVYIYMYVHRCIYIYTCI